MHVCMYKYINYTYVWLYITLHYITLHFHVHLHAHVHLDLHLHVHLHLHLHYITYIHTHVYRSTYRFIIYHFVYILFFIDLGINHLSTSKVQQVQGIWPTRTLFEAADHCTIALVFRHPGGMRWQGGFVRAMGVPPTHPKLDHVSIETIGDLGILHFQKPPYEYHEYGCKARSNTSGKNAIVVEDACWDVNNSPIFLVFGCDLCLADVDRIWRNRESPESPTASENHVTYYQAHTHKCICIFIYA